MGQDRASVVDFCCRFAKHTLNRRPVKQSTFICLLVEWQKGACENHQMETILPNQPKQIGHARPKTSQRLDDRAQVVVQIEQLRHHQNYRFHWCWICVVRLPQTNKEKQHRISQLVRIGWIAECRIGWIWHSSHWSFAIWHRSCWRPRTSQSSIRNNKAQKF